MYGLGSKLVWNSDEQPVELVHLRSSFQCVYLDWSNASVVDYSHRVFLYSPTYMCFDRFDPDIFQHQNRQIRLSVHTFQSQLCSVVLFQSLIHFEVHPRSHPRFLLLLTGFSDPMARSIWDPSQLCHLNKEEPRRLQTLIGPTLFQNKVD